MVHQHGFRNTPTPILIHPQKQHKTMAKYQYVKVIQFGYNGQWSDESEYVTKADGSFKSNDDRLAFNNDLRQYKIAHKSNGQTRVVQRRIPNQ